MLSIKQSDAVVWMWVQVLAQVVIKADNRDRQQNNL
jgi:hypothetical protein